MAEVAKITSVLFFEDDLTAKRVLEKEADKLLLIARKEWLKVMAKYQPTAYVRTDKSYQSIKKTHVRKTAFGWTIDVIFENDLAYHESVVRGSGKQPKGHAIWLNHAGWKVKKGKHKDIPNFGYRKGSGYLFIVLNEYRARKDPRVSLEITWDRKKI